MFGTKEEFKYVQCGYCNCLQLVDIPEDLSRYYPPDYYSLNTTYKSKASALQQLMLKQRFKNAIFGKGYKLNKLLTHFVEMPDLRVDSALPITQLLKKSEIKDFSARFLDIGCGSWSLWLEGLKTMGFNHLTGVDPFIKEDISTGGINIHKRQISEVDGTFDLITFHHSLEHIPEQEKTLQAARRLLAPNGVILVRIPTVSSYAWKHYGTDWVEMDPPRHLYLHSRASVDILGKKSGLKLYSTLCDSIELEFYGSEQYLKGIPLTSKDSYWKCKDSKLFSPQEIEQFKDKARFVNKEDECGRACFFFKADQ